MQVFDLAAVDGALLCGGALLYLRSIKRDEAIFAGVAAAMLVAAHWFAPYPLYAVAAILCPVSFLAFLVRSRDGWRRLRMAVAGRSLRGRPVWEPRD